jgi:glycerol kinase
MTAPSIAAIALDLGTTSIKAGLLDQDGVLSNIVALPAPKVGGQDGHYESDALAYAAIAEKVLAEFIQQAGDCKSLGMCSQRSSFLIWEQATGQPITPLISWQDNRGAESCVALRAHEKSIRSLTGLPLTPYYFAPKLRIVLQENPGWPALLESGEFRVGTLDTFLIWRWSDGRHFVTDASMAARTLLMDIRQQQWSPQLCDLFGIPICILPVIKSSEGLKLKLDNGLVLKASVGDQSAALIASMEGGRSEALVNLGTGGFVVRYLSDEMPWFNVVSGADEMSLADEMSATDGYLRTLVCQDCAHRLHLAIEGTLNSIAAALEPYPVGECRIEDFAQDEIFCLAEPSGLGAPYFRGDIGTKFSQPVQNLSPHRIATLLLEAIIFRVARILEEFHSEREIERVYLSGGLSELGCLQQGIAQCVPFEVYRLTQAESSLQGAALLAAGMSPAFHRNGSRIEVANNDKALPDKFRRWKVWLDDLLALK